jgi:hypothetical protein
MYLAYIDESGEVGRQGTTHFVLIAFAIPAGSWKAKDREIERLKVTYRIPEAEAHTAFMARRYIEQEHIPNFAALSDADRRAAVAIERKKALAQTALRGHDAVKAMVKTYKKTEAYVHRRSPRQTRLPRRCARSSGSGSYEIACGCERRMTLRRRPTVSQRFPRTSPQSAVVVTMTASDVIIQSGHQPEEVGWRRVKPA